MAPLFDLILKTNGDITTRAKSCVMRVNPGVLAGCTIPMRSVALFSVTRHRPGHQLIARTQKGLLAAWSF